ncbi:MAG: hypothetical protein ACRDN0_24080 [Trebonia sp.]
MFKSPAGLGRKLSDIGVPSQSLETLPVPMRRAVRFMLAGAGATAVWGLFFIIAAAVDTSGAVGPDGKKISGTGLAAEIVFLALEAVIYVALWVLMARKSQSGRNWARITSSVLFILWSYQTYGTLGTMTASPIVIVNLILVLAIWVIGLGALVMLWRQESSLFFKAQSSR